jgi:cytochrome c|tara:strand:- start:245 stop:430 length:186 start_codon:yes stop_codon:yes gene_type:complete
MLMALGVILYAATLQAQPDLQQREALYERQCAACHGEQGDGRERDRAGRKSVSEWMELRLE